jgi:hypothetical protein
VDGATVLALLSGLVATACIVASARRLAFALAPTSLDPDLLLRALRAMAGPTPASMVRALRSRSDLGWESDLPASLTRDGEAESLLDLAWRVQRWSRVPRVCASISTSAGFFFACLGVLGGLAATEGEVATPVSPALLGALDALAIGMAGTSFCVAVHLRARRCAGVQMAVHERLLRALEEASAGHPAPAEQRSCPDPNPGP